MFKILAVQINGLNVVWQIPCRVVKQQGLTASAAGEHGVILARTDVAQRTGYVYVRNGLRSGTLDAKVLVDEFAECVELFCFR